MFMEIAIGAIGIGIVLMVGYLVIAQVTAALPTPTSQYANACRNHYLNDTTYCNTTSVSCGPITDNASETIVCDSAEYLSGTSAVKVTVFAGFGLIAVSIIVLAAFGLINIFR